MKYLIVLVVAALTTVSCKTQQKGHAECRYEGTVKDMSGLDGCGMMIELKDGSRLQPVEFKEPGFTLKDGQHVKLNYTELKDRMTTCMSGKVVRVECIREEK
ncbi:MAG TPA: hypothetical protein VM802_03140 [Chitinophaga sp.]|uniref:hypothetical protein n=1 Tax=Chitinophaga sp. TaxID=1869181 RepID=UPI002C450CC4|nr:hypothetical protein [Chitinophaga sp.]HVI43830.1 hypothetical protein [Chitinophaga sp.]